MPPLCACEDSQCSLPACWLCSLALPKASALSDGDAGVALDIMRAPAQAAPASPAGCRASFWPGCWEVVSARPHRAAGSIASRRATPTCCAAPVAAHMLSSAAITAPSRGCAALLRAALAPAQPRSHRFPLQRRELSPWQAFFLLGRRKGLESHPLWLGIPALHQDFLLLQRCRLLHIHVLGFFLSVNSHEANLAEDVKREPREGQSPPRKGRERSCRVC